MVGQTVAIDGKTHKLSQLLKGCVCTMDRMSFTIHLEQRVFQWGDGRVRRFVTQILNRFELRANWHIVGKVNLRLSTDVPNELEISDGAHRVTMLVIILSVLRHVRCRAFATLPPDDSKREILGSHLHGRLIFGEVDEGTYMPRFRPKQHQRAFFERYINPERDNLGQLWTGDDHREMNWSAAGGNIINQRYMACARVVYEQLRNFKTARHDQPLAAPLTDSVGGKAFRELEAFILDVHLQVEVMTGGSPVERINYFISANEVSVGLTPLDHAKAMMLAHVYDAEGGGGDVAAKIADEWDTSFLALSKHKIECGSVTVNKRPSPSTAFEELFTSVILGRIDPGRRRTSAARVWVALFGEVDMCEDMFAPDGGTSRVAVRRKEPSLPEALPFNLMQNGLNFYLHHFKPANDAMQCLFDCETLCPGDEAYDGVRGRLQVISKTIKEGERKGLAKIWLAPICVALERFIDRPSDLDDIMRAFQIGITWHVISRDAQQLPHTHLMGNYGNNAESGEEQRLVPLIIRTLDSDISLDQKKTEVMEHIGRFMVLYRVVKGEAGETGGHRTRHVRLIEDLGKITYSSTKREQVNLFLAMYEDALRRKEKVEAGAYARETALAGGATIEHIVSQSPRRREELDASWKGVRLDKTSPVVQRIGNLCLVPARLNAAASDASPVEKVQRVYAPFFASGARATADSDDGDVEIEDEPGCAALPTPTPTGTVHRGFIGLYRIVTLITNNKAWTKQMADEMATEMLATVHDYLGLSLRFGIAGASVMPGTPPTVEEQVPKENQRTAKRAKKM